MYVFIGNTTQYIRPLRVTLVSCEVTSLAASNLSIFIPVVMFINSNMPTRSSVARFPDELGANGQPPKPPMHESNLLMPASRLE